MTTIEHLEQLSDLLISTPKQRATQHKMHGHARYWDIHDQAVHHYVIGLPQRLSEGERRTLCLLDALHSYSKEPCWFLCPHVIQPLSDAISDALSAEIGRLDGGNLSRAHHAIIDYVEAQGFEITR